MYGILPYIAYIYHKNQLNVDGMRPLLQVTVPDTNMSPENQWLEDAFPIEIVPFEGQGLC